MQSNWNYFLIQIIQSHHSSIMVLQIGKRLFRGSLLRVLCPTRWSVRHASISNILKDYEVLQSTLEEVQEGHNEYAAKANGLFSKMEQFETYFELQFTYLLFAPAEQFSTNV